MKGKYLISTDSWFHAPDGKLYRAVWGEVQILEDSFLGVKTNSKSTNWYAKIGSEENHLIIAGCQVHYAVRCDKKPRDTNVMDFEIHNGEVKGMCKPQVIYIAE